MDVETLCVSQDTSSCPLTPPPEIDLFALRSIIIPWKMEMKENLLNLIEFNRISFRCIVLAPWTLTLGSGYRSLGQAFVWMPFTRSLFPQGVGENCRDEVDVFLLAPYSYWPQRPWFPRLLSHLVGTGFFIPR